MGDAVEPFGVVMGRGWGLLGRLGCSFRGLQKGPPRWEGGLYLLPHYCWVRSALRYEHSVFLHVDQEAPARLQHLLFVLAFRYLFDPTIGTVEVPSRPSDAREVRIQGRIKLASLGSRPGSCSNPCRPLSSAGSPANPGRSPVCQPSGRPRWSCIPGTPSPR